MSRLRHRIASGAALMAGFLAGSTPASAGTVTVRTSFPGTRTVEFVAAAGERNAVAVEVAGDPYEFQADVAWTVTDTGAPLEAGAGCVALTANTARCSAQQREISVFLGGGDDRFSMTGTTFAVAQVRGGAGDDRISGAPGHGVLDGDGGDDTIIGGSGGGVLDGGPGDDRLFGGAGFDSLDGGGGRDELHGGPDGDFLTDGDLDLARGDVGAGPDLLDGGPGGAVVIYETRAKAVRIDLGAGRVDGPRGERDRLRHITGAIGGSADDVLIGNGRANVLDGKAGANRVVGRDGDDLLLSERGPIDCGPGDDTVAASPGSRALLLPGCEAIVSERGGDDDPTPPYPRPREGGVMRFRIHCPFLHSEEGGGQTSCSGAVTLREATGRRRALGRATFPHGPWTDRPVDVRLTALGRRLMSRANGVRTAVTLTRSGSEPLRWGIWLRP